MSFVKAAFADNSFPSFTVFLGFLLLLLGLSTVPLSSVPGTGTPVVEPVSSSIGAQTRTLYSAIRPPPSLCPWHVYDKLLDFPVCKFLVGWEWWESKALVEPYKAYHPYTFGSKSTDLFGII